MRDRDSSRPLIQVANGGSGVIVLLRSPRSTEGLPRDYERRLSDSRRW